MSLGSSAHEIVDCSNLVGIAALVIFTCIMHSLEADQGLFKVQHYFPTSSKDYALAPSHKSDRPVQPADLPRAQYYTHKKVTGVARDFMSKISESPSSNIVGEGRFKFT